ncbi:xanthohumol 4-O-methyltransferase-like [Ziziphus jujuba]|uniref:Xanthohumol 4-O-methyltransferase-like n=1 Tax=Ziziphus jujuba TaxID=326968 RepID=A0ABM4A680_ZIZJJ|nr:xanthohumol 4-O-methyltransferase-like [Ziziphus jujuba]
MVLMQNHANLLVPWHCFSGCVKEGGFAFNKAHGSGIWAFASQNPDFNKLFNDAMECSSRIMSKAIVSAYKDGFGSVKSLVDVGGGTGRTMAEIVKAYPHIKGINFDLPHVIATAPAYDGVSHIGGDMFEGIPNADAVFIKWILHDWDDEYCVKILKNCRKAVPEKSGKVIIIDMVLKAKGNDNIFDEIGMMFDMVTLALTEGGKERTDKEWKKILKEGGFPRYKIINIPAVASIIEAYPE